MNKKDFISAAKLGDKKMSMNNLKNDEVKPCEICSATPTISQVEENVWRVFCDQGYRYHCIMIYGKTQQDAINRWQARSPTSTERTGPKGYCKRCDDPMSECPDHKYVKVSTEKQKLSEEALRKNVLTHLQSGLHYLGAAANWLNEKDENTLVNYILSGLRKIQFTPRKSLPSVERFVEIIMNEFVYYPQDISGQIQHKKLCTRIAQSIHDELKKGCE